MRKISIRPATDKKETAFAERLMKWRCPHPDKARLIGCPDINKDNLCVRKEWSGGITYLKGNKLGALVEAEVYCERIKRTLHKE